MGCYKNNLLRIWISLSLVISLSACSFFRSTKPTDYLYHTIQSGDTLYDLANVYGVDIEELSKLNEIDDPRTLQVGAILKIPSKNGGIYLEPNLRNIQPAKNSIKSVASSKAKNQIGNLIWPVHGAQLISKFGRRWLSFHEGIDLAAPIGTSIFAAHDGVVAYSGSKLNGYGNMVILKGKDIITVYAHNRSNLVENGENVKKGESIAILGNTGRVTGPHLHFETRIKDEDGDIVVVDPLVFYKNTGSQ